MSDDIDLFCPSCNIMTAARIEASTTKAGIESDMFDPDADLHHVSLMIALCRRCDGPFLVRTKTVTIGGEFTSVSSPEVLYPKPQRGELKDVPKSIADAIFEARKTFDVGAYTGCILMATRALESMCHEKHAPKGTLISMLKWLHGEGILDKRLADWAHEIRTIRNDAAHEAEFVATAEDARDTLDLVESIVLVVYTIDRRFSAFKARNQSR